MVLPVVPVPVLEVPPVPVFVALLFVLLAVEEVFVFEGSDLSPPQAPSMPRLVNVAKAANLILLM